MTTDPTDAANRARLADLYQATLLDDVMPFWLRHGLDREHGGILTALARDSSLLDTDKSVWFQGRAAWMFATLFSTVEPCEDLQCGVASQGHFLNPHAHAYPRP